MHKALSLFHQSAAEFKNLRSLVGLALCLAMSVILESIGTIQLTPWIQLSFSFLTAALAGMLYGPICGGISGALTDILVFFLHPTGPYYFPGFTLTSLLYGVIYGLFLYKNKCSLPRLILSKLCVTLFLNLLLNSLWLTLLYDQAFLALLPTRLLKNLIMLPAEVFLLWLVLPRVSKLLPPQSQD